MAWSIIARSWGCLTPSQRNASFDLALAYSTPSPFVLKVLVDAYFILQYGTSAEPYRAAWQSNFRVQQGTVTVEGESVSVYLSNRTWMGELKAKLLSGCLSLSDPLCQQLTFPSPKPPPCIWE